MINNKMNLLHDDCLMNFTCDDCKKDYCEHCEKECVNEHMERLCPHCIKVYNVNYEKHFIEKHYCDFCYDYESDTYDMCDECLFGLYYCFDCNVAYCIESKMHLEHDNNEFINIYKNKEYMDKFREHNEEIYGELKNVNIRLDIIELVCNDIENIDNDMIEFKKYFETEITYGDILYEMVNYDKLKWYLEYLYKKGQNIKSLINNNAKGKYESDKLSPPITNVKSMNNLKLLIEYGGDINARGENPECTCLYKNVSNIMDEDDDDSIKIVKYLVENGVDVNLGNPLKLITNRSNLHRHLHRQEILKLLINKGAIVTDEMRLKHPDFFNSLY